MAEKRSDQTLFIPTNDILYSKVPPELLVVIATYLTPHDMAELAHLGRIAPHIVAIASSQLVTFKIKSRQPVIDSLKFILKDPSDPNEKHTSLRHLDIAQNISKQERSWIVERFPYAKILTSIMQLNQGDELFDALPKEFVALNPNQVYQIRDPEEEFAPFILSPFSARPMIYPDAIQFCEEKGARLPTKEEFEILKRAMTRNNKYRSNLIPSRMGAYFWSSTPYPLGARRAFVFSGDSGNLYDGDCDLPHAVMCVR